MTLGELIAEGLTRGDIIQRITSCKEFTKEELYKVCEIEYNKLTASHIQTNMEFNNGTTMKGNYPSIEVFKLNNAGWDKL